MIIHHKQHMKCSCRDWRREAVCEHLVPSLMTKQLNQGICQDVQKNRIALQCRLKPFTCMLIAWHHPNLCFHSSLGQLMTFSISAPSLRLDFLLFFKSLKFYRNDKCCYKRFMIEEPSKNHFRFSVLVVQPPPLMSPRLQMVCRALWELLPHRQITLVTADLRGMAGHYRNDLRPHTNTHYMSTAQVDNWQEIDIWWRQVVYAEDFMIRER